MNIITKINFKTSDELLKKRFHLFNKEIIIPYKEFKKLDNQTVKSLKVQGCYFTFSEVE